MRISRLLYRWAAVLCLVAAWGGCVPGRAEMTKAIKGYSLPAEVEPGKGLIFITDALQLKIWHDRTVLLDGDDGRAKIGTLESASYIYTLVPAGHHRIKMPEWSPYEVVVEVEEGDILFLQPAKDQRQRKNVVQQVDGVVGRYAVKRFKLGDMSRTPEQKAEGPDVAPEMMLK